MENNHKDPVKLFENWYDLVKNTKTPEPTAMTLSTINAQGRPTSRVVLLKYFKNGEFYFFTNYESSKGKELSANPFASLNFHWHLPLHRQVRVEGEVRKTSLEDNQVYFESRPHGSQIGAWASKQSQKLKKREILEQEVKNIEEKFKNQKVPCPPHWGGFIIKPYLFEFWEGKESRLHERFVFEKSGNEWLFSLLNP